MSLRLASFLHTGQGQPPTEFLTLILCRDVYSCPPSVLMEEPLENVLPHLTCLEVEAQVREMKKDGGPERGRPVTLAPPGQPDPVE